MAATKSIRTTLPNSFPYSGTVTASTSVSSVIGRSPLDGVSRPRG